MSDLPAPNALLLPFTQRIRREIVLADQAWLIARVSGERASGINSRNFGELFGVLQGALADRLALSVTNLFERAFGRHPSHSVPALLARIRQLSSDIEVRDRERILSWLAHQGSDRSSLHSDSAITEEMLRVLELRLPSPADVNARLSRILEAVKARRDKLITHSEVLSAESLSPVTWGELNELVRFAKEVLSLVGWGYLDTAYAPEIGHQGHFLAQDAERSASALRRLLSASGIEPE